MILEEKLPNLDINIKSRIRSGIDSIYRIDLNDKSFKQLIDDNIRLKETYYIVSSNDNTSNNILFLNESGAIIENSNISISKLIFLPLGFDIDYSFASDNSEILKEYKNYSIPLFENKI